MDDSDVLDTQVGIQSQPEIQQNRNEQLSTHDRDVAQESSIERSTTSAASMSIRLSCDRCRLQKLKCAVPAGSDICERCTRAKVPCLFGRRTYSKSRNRSGTKARSSTTTIPPTAPGVSESLPVHRDPAVLETSRSQELLSKSPSKSPSMSASPCADYPSLFPDWNVDSLMTGSTTLDDHISTHDFGNQQNCNLEDTYGSYLYVGLDYDSVFDPVTGSFTSLQQHNHTLGEDSHPVMIGQAGSSPQHFINPVTLPTTADPGSQQHNISTADAHSTIIGLSNISRISPQTSLKLTSLVLQIQGQLHELEEGSWQDLESRTNLVDYPVGNILELSQKFSAVAGDILSNTTTGLNGSGGGASGLDTSGNRGTGLSPLPSEAGVDTPTVLLVTAGYMRLMQIYSLVLDHLKQYLNDVLGPDLNQSLDKMMDCSSTKSTDKALEPSAEASVASSTLWSSSSSSSGLAFRPDGLLSNNTVVYLYQIHAAVRMVQDALRDIEGRLGRGGVFARDMAVGLLRSPSNRLDTQLENTATGIRELIRERFHF